MYRRFLFCAASLAWGSLCSPHLVQHVHCRLTCPVRSPTNILLCFLSSLLMNRIYLSIGPFRHSWLVPYLSQTFHSVCFLFSIQFLILDLNLLQDSGRKGSGPMGLVLAPLSFARIFLSLVSSGILFMDSQKFLQLLILACFTAILYQHWASEYDFRCSGTFWHKATLTFLLAFFQSLFFLSSLRQRSL